MTDGYLKPAAERPNEPAQEVNGNTPEHGESNKSSEEADVNTAVTGIKDELVLPPAADDTDSDESVDARYASIRAEEVATYFTSDTLLKAQKYRSGLNADKKRKARRQARPEVPKDPALGLIKGLVEYIRIVEDRIEASDASVAQKSAELKKTVSQVVDEPEVRLAIKFFDAASYLTDEGLFPELKEDPEHGTFFCGQDTQNLIRVLYVKLRNDSLKPHKSADPADPTPEEIDILTFGVTSEAIATFFSRELGITGGDEGLIRFGKPFKPIIRHHQALRSHLQKLERSYGQVTTDTNDVEEQAQQGTPEATEPSSQQRTELISSYPAASDTGAEGFDAHTRPEALLPFRILIQFLDTYLGRQIVLYERLKNAEEQKVAFENLWMLYDVRETIYCPSREAKTSGWWNTDTLENHSPVPQYAAQAYRVVATTGGLPLEDMMHLRHRGKGGSDHYSSDGPLVASGNNTGVAALADVLKQTLQASRAIKTSYTSFEVYCCYVDFDGQEFGTVADVFVFRPFEREMDIRSLQAYPARYLARDDLQARGTQFLDVTRISHLQYEGLTVGPVREEINSPVVVDMSMAFETSGDNSKALITAPKFKAVSALWVSGRSSEVYDVFGTSACPHKWCYNQKCNTNTYINFQREQREKIASEIRVVLEEYESEKQSETGTLEQFKKALEEKDVLRLLPGVVPGYALRNRRWVLLSLTKLEPLEKSNKWDKLVLPRGHREMVQAMVETHTQSPGSEQDARVSMDLVKGKGRGCVILLHGVPGVGKTSTAECVAAHTRKPLYPITCGDIGYQPEDVERNMENHFKLAHKWGCVLLLDEADVFLAKRDPRDAKRNSLVSVFLRILEYYSGILFLTTNRVGAIDDAFRSRLHLILYYPPLKIKQAKKIFKQNFERIEEVNEVRKAQKLLPFEYKDSEDKIMRWVKENWENLKWNGRQIRNTFQTVLALTEFLSKADDGTPLSPKLERRHFKTVANASRQFNEYLQETHGMDEEKTAKRDLIRAPSYNPAPELQFKGLWGDDSDTSSYDGSEDSSKSDSDGSSFDDGGKSKKKQKAKAKRKKQESKSRKSSSDKKATFSKKRKSETNKKNSSGDESDDGM